MSPLLSILSNHESPLHLSPIRERGRERAIRQFLSAPFPVRACLGLLSVMCSVVSIEAYRVTVALVKCFVSWHLPRLAIGTTKHVRVKWELGQWIFSEFQKKCTYYSDPWSCSPTWCSCTTIASVDVGRLVEAGSTLRTLVQDERHGKIRDLFLRTGTNVLTRLRGRSFERQKGKPPAALRQHSAQSPCIGKVFIYHFALVRSSFVSATLVPSLISHA